MNPSIRSATFAALTFAACFAVAAPTASAQSDPVRARIARGDRIEFRLEGREYRDLDAARVVVGSRGSSTTRYVAADLGPWVDGGRDLVISASRYTPTGYYYRIEGQRAGRTTMLLPISMEVTTDVTSRHLAPTTRAPQRLTTRVEQLAQKSPKLFTEPVTRMERYRDELRRYLPTDPILADAMAGRLRGVPVPRPGSVHGSNDYHGVPGDSATLVLDIVPQSPAQVGQTVTIHSFGLPCPANGDQIRIRLANLELQILESTPDHATARLPNFPVTGVLEAIRVSDGRHAILEDEYAVTPAFEPYDHFEATASGHSEVNAFLLAVASQGVYRNAGESPAAYQQRLVGQFTPWGVNQVTSFDEGGLFSGTPFTDTQGAVFETDDAVIIAFAGTQTDGVNLIDPATDLIAFPVMPRGWGVTLHAGFHAAHDPVLPSGQRVFQIVRARAQAGRSAGKQVWVTGHSLGGAIAQITAFRLQAIEGIYVRGVVTFGSPMVGLSDWQRRMTQLFGNRAIRWANYMDPVPLVPGNMIPGLSYRHSGRLINIDAAGNLDDSGVPMTNFPMTVKGFAEDHMHYWKHAQDEFLETTLAKQYPGLWPELDPHTNAF